MHRSLEKQIAWERHARRLKSGKPPRRPDISERIAACAKGQHGHLAARFFWEGIGAWFGTCVYCGSTVRDTSEDALHDGLDRLEAGEV